MMGAAHPTRRERIDEMLGNIIIVLVLAIIAAVMFVISKIADYNNDYLWGISGITIGVIALVWAISIPMCYIEISRETNTFKEQSAYITTHEPRNDIEDAALTNKKIELNEWLYQAQWAKEKFGIFSFVPDEVVDFEPIQ